jgi:hypothetical protein
VKGALIMGKGFKLTKLGDSLVSKSNVSNLVIPLKISPTPCTSATHSFIEHTPHGIVRRVVTTKIDRN